MVEYLYKVQPYFIVLYCILYHEPCTCRGQKFDIWDAFVRAIGDEGKITYKVLELHVGSVQGFKFESFL